MNDDVLRRAARALRERESGEPLAHRATKDEVLRALAHSPPAPSARRARRPFFALAAALVLSTAWAASAGHLPTLRHALAVALGTPPEPTTLTPESPEPPPNAYAARAAASSPRGATPPDAADAADAASGQAAPPKPAPPPAPVARASTNDPTPGPGEWFAPSPPLPTTTPSPTTTPAPSPTTTPAPSPATTPAPSPATTPAPPLTASPRAPARAPRPPRASAAPASTAPSAAPPADPTPSAAPNADELYERAHRAHFGGRDPAAALAAWNDYLAAAPRGRFALEARYNRALALARLGRRDEAARALEPFAAGDFGGYRQGEAKRLLQSLRAPE